MSDFSRAYSRTMRHEGGYSANPRDTGGETYKGISRVNRPKWGGWRLVDDTKAGLIKPPTYGTTSYSAWVNHLNGLLASRPNLQVLVQAFYKDSFWKRLGEINDQRVAEEVFDKSVNCGNVASFWLQRATSVTADGIIGAKTVAAVNAANPVMVLDSFNEQARHYYENIIKRDPSQECFRKAWMARLKNYDDV